LRDTMLGSTVWPWQGQEQWRHTVKGLCGPHGSSMYAQSARKQQWLLRASWHAATTTGRRGSRESRPQGCRAPRQGSAAAMHPTEASRAPCAPPHSESSTCSQPCTFSDSSCGPMAATCIGALTMRSPSQPRRAHHQPKVCRTALPKCGGRTGRRGQQHRVRQATTLPLKRQVGCCALQVMAGCCLIASRPAFTDDSQCAPAAHTRCSTSSRRGAAAQAGCSGKSRPQYLCSCAS
jgi:hypothetical protein